MSKTIKIIVTDDDAKHHNYLMGTMSEELIQDAKKNNIYAVDEMVSALCLAVDEELELERKNDENT